MSSFKGSYNYTVDAKGRFNVPAKMRKNLSPEANNSFVITRGHENCIYAYPNDEWTKIENELRTLNQNKIEARNVTRDTLEFASDVELDGQYRITLTKELIDFAKINGEVFILGALNRIEVWNPDEYKKHKEARTAEYAAIAEKVFTENNSEKNV